APVAENAQLEYTGLSVESLGDQFVSPFLVSDTEHATLALRQVADAHAGIRPSIAESGTLRADAMRFMTSGFAPRRPASMSQRYWREMPAASARFFLVMPSLTRIAVSAAWFTFMTRCYAYSCVTVKGTREPVSIRALTWAFLRVTGVSLRISA